MAKKIVEHEEFGPVLLDTSTGTYQYFEPQQRTWFIRNGSWVEFFESVPEFLRSKAEIAVVPVVCADAGRVKRGKRLYIDVIDWDNNNYKFYNWEPICKKWVENKSKYIYKGRLYFLLLEKNQYAMNDMLLLSALEIKKRESTPPL